MLGYGSHSEETRNEERFTEEQKAFALRQADSGVPIREKLRISEATFYRRKKYGGLGVAEIRRPRQLKHENSRLGCLNGHWFLTLDDAGRRSSVASGLQRAQAAQQPGQRAPWPVRVRGYSRYWNLAREMDQILGEVQ